MASSLTSTAGRPLPTTTVCCCAAAQVGSDTAKPKANAMHCPRRNPVVGRFPIMDLFPLNNLSSTLPIDMPARLPSSEQ